MSDNQNLGLNFNASNDINNPFLPTLPDALGIVKTKLQQAASNSALFYQVFGDKANIPEIQSVRTQWAIGDFSQLPQVQILSAANMNGADGAYSSSTQKIYLSEALSQSNFAIGVLVEETFHWLDDRVGTDTKGDEGELARVLVLGESVSNAELARIKQEDDRGFIIAEGQSIFVEKSGSSVTIESQGNGKLIKSANNLLSAQIGNDTPISIKYNGLQIYTTIFAGWETVAVENIGGQNQLLWKSASTNSISLWNLDSNWNFLSSAGVIPLNSGSTLIQETNFGLDINGDGFVGESVSVVTVSATDSVSAETISGQAINNGVFTLTRTVTNTAIAVNYTLSGTATNGIDYLSLNGVANFAIGASTAIVSVSPIDDALFEGNETVILTLAAGSGYTLNANNNSTITISDNDLPTITVTANDASAAEVVTGQIQNPGQFTFTRTGSTANPLTVNFGLGGSATSGFDYSALATSVTFAAGASTAVVNINVTDDAIVEGSETVFLQLLANAAYTLGAATSATVTIADNDVENITVTSPNGGNSLQRGQSVTIQWNDNIPDNVRVDLYKNNIFYRNITTSTPSNGSLSWTVPNDVLLGTDYRIRIAKTDGTLIDFSDNNFTITGTSNVDLKGYLLVPAVNAMGAGTTQTVYYNIQNSGADTSGAFRVGFYLSMDTIFTTGDRFLGSETINSLAGISVNGNLSKSLTLPVAGDSFYSGDKTYYIGMIVDDLNAVAETNEGNNSGQRAGDDYAAVTVSGTVPTPFITVLSPNTSNTLTRGQNYNIQWNDNIAENVRIDLYKAGAFYRNIVASTASTGNYVWNVPTDTVANPISNVPNHVSIGSDYTIRIQSTTNTTLFDTSDTNFTITGTPNYDLFGSLFNVTQSATSAGSTVQYTYTIQNNGSDPTSLFKVGFYISPDANFTTSDYLVGEITTSIDAKSAKTFSASLNSATFNNYLNLPPQGNSFWSGDKTYYIGSIADLQNVITD